MDIILYMQIIVTILGLLIGSFLNVCIYRIPRGESIVYTPSHCTGCNNKIKRYDLIPVVSWLILRGKCRSCGEKISARYPLIETLNAIIYLGLFLKFGPTIEFLKYAVLASILIVTSLIDFDSMDVPDNLMLFGAITGLLFNLASYGFSSQFVDHVCAAAIGGGVILLIIVVTKGMGSGDVEIMAVVGLFVGVRPILNTIFMSFIMSAVVGLILIALKKKTRQDYMPFGPWISLAAIVSILLTGVYSII